MLGLSPTMEVKTVSFIASFATRILVSDEKVIKIMLPMIAIAVLACVVGYYIKNKFCKVDEDEENKKEKDLQRDLEKMRFPAPKANKPWLNMPPTNSQFRICRCF